MKSVKQQSFLEFGRILERDFGSLLDALMTISLPKSKYIYVSNDEELAKDSIVEQIKRDYLNNLSIQVCYYAGYNHYMEERKRLS